MASIVKLIVAVLLMGVLAHTHFYLTDVNKSVYINGAGYYGGVNYYPDKGFIVYGGHNY